MKVAILRLADVDTLLLLSLATASWHEIYLETRGVCNG